MEEIVNCILINIGHACCAANRDENFPFETIRSLENEASTLNSAVANLNPIQKLEI